MDKNNTNILQRVILFEKTQKSLVTWISDYDKGTIVKSIEMGGMGEGYELAIQECLIEILRSLQHLKPSEEPESFTVEVKDATNKAVAKLDETFGFSGAQVSAAQSLASFIWRNTLEKAFKEISEERIIKIFKSKNGTARLIKE